MEDRFSKYPPLTFAKDAQRNDSLGYRSKPGKHVPNDTKDVTSDVDMADDSDCSRDSDSVLHLDSTPATSNDLNDNNSGLSNLYTNTSSSPHTLIDKQPSSEYLDSDRKHARGHVSVSRCDVSGNSDSFFYNGKSEQLHSSTSWPLAEGNGWTPNSGLNEESTLCRSSISNYNTVSQTSSCKSVKEQTTDDTDEDEEKSFRFSKLTRTQKVILASTSLTNLLSFWSLSILAPFFPLEAEKKNVSQTISGWIFGVFSLVQFLFSPLFGRLLPVIGSKFMYLAGVFICGGCTLCFGMLDQIDTTNGIFVYVLMCFATRVLLALGCTSLNNAGFVMLVRAFPNSVATVFGIGEIFTGLGMVTGPALGGFLFDAGGFFLPFAVIGVSCLIALPVIWILLPPQDDSHEPASEGLSVWKVVLPPKSLVNSIVIVVGASIWAVLDPTLEPHLRVYNLGPSMVGVLFLIMAAFYSISSPFWGWLVDKMPDNRALLIPGFLLAATGLLLAGPSPALGFDLGFNELWLTIISLVILGVASSMIIIPTYDIYIEVLEDVGYPEDTRTYGMVSGLWVSMYALGDFTGPSLGGFLDEEIGFEWLTTWFAAGCALTSIIVAVSWYVEVKCCIKRPPSSNNTADVTSGDVTLTNSDTAPLLYSSSGPDFLRTYPPHAKDDYPDVVKSSEM